MGRRATAIGMCALAALVAGCVDYGPAPARAACQELLLALGRAPGELSDLICANVGQAVADSAIAFDPDMQEACLAEARAAATARPLTPTWFREQLPSCLAMYASRRLVGEGCRLSLECPAGAYCDASGASCPGECRAYLVPDEPCGARAEACDPERELCDLTCTALAAEDEACGPSRPCQPSLSCVDGACLPSQAEGGPCDLAAGFGPGCDGGLYCAPDGACRPPRGADEACLTREELAEIASPGGTAGLGLLVYEQCAEGLACQGGQCLGLAPSGAPCDPADWPACQDGLGCDPAGEVCAALLPPGAPCAAAGLGCQAGSFCRRAEGEEEGLCTPLGAEGQPCQGALECAAGLACRDGACSPNHCLDFLVPTRSQAAAQAGIHRGD